MQRAVIVQHRCELMQLRIAKTFGLDGFHGREHVIAVQPGAAVALPHEVQLLVEAQTPRILHVAAIHHIGQRADAGPRRVIEPRIAAIRRASDTLGGDEGRILRSPLSTPEATTT